MDESLGPNVDGGRLKFNINYILIAVMSLTAASRSATQV